MRALILGAGICGLGTALLLARDGHEVTVLERDPDPMPDSPQGRVGPLDLPGRGAVSHRTISCPGCGGCSKPSCPIFRTRCYVLALKR